MTKILLSILFLYLPFQVALNPAEGVDLASIRIIIPIIFLLWLIQGLKNKKLIIPHTSITIFVFSFLFISGFSLVVATNIEWGLRKFLFLLSIFPLYFALINLKNKEKLSLLKFLVFGSFLSALLGIFQFSLQFIFGIDRALDIWSYAIVPFLGTSFSEAVLTNSSWLVNAGGHTLFRAVAFFPDPHMFSFYLGMSAPIALALYLKLKNNRNFYLISFIVILVADFLTFSRGGYLGLLSGLILGFIFYHKKHFSFSKEKIRSLLLATVLIFIFILTIAIIPNPVSNRLHSSFDLSEGSNTERIEIWRESLDIIEDNMFLGVGLGNYSLSVKPSAEYREPIYSHNTYMDVVAEIGIFGALAWIFILLFSMLKALEVFKKKNDIVYLGMFSSLVAFSVHSVFETAIFSVHVLPLLILLIGLISTKKDE